LPEPAAAMAAAPAPGGGRERHVQRSECREIKGFG
jgi:hypothetical protein